MADYKSVVECNQVDAIAVVEVEADRNVATLAVADIGSEIVCSLIAVAAVAGTVDIVNMGLVFEAIVVVAEMGLLIVASFIPLFKVTQITFNSAYIFSTTQSMIVSNYRGVC